MIIGVAVLISLDQTGYACIRYAQDTRLHAFDAETPYSLDIEAFYAAMARALTFSGSINKNSIRVPEVRTTKKMRHSNP